MARNREPVTPVVDHHSTDEELTSEETDSEEYDSEPEQTLTQSQSLTSKKSQPQILPSTAPKPQQPLSSSDEEEESGSESDSEGSDLNVRPPVSKPTEKAPKANNGAVTPTKSGAAKRPAQETPTTDAKKKKTADAESSEKKPNLFQRLWSEDDEIAILQGMIDYYTIKKIPAYADLDGFHDFIKSNLQTNFTRNQLQDKIRRLKKKYVNNKSKEKEGKERTFPKPHEQRAYELSKIVWEGHSVPKGTGVAKAVGSPKANGSVVRNTATKSVNAAKSEEVKDVKNAMIVSGEGEKKLNPSSSGATTEERILVAGSELFEAGRGLVGQHEWEKLRVEEFQLYLKQLELRTAQTKLVLSAMQGGDH